VVLFTVSCSKPGITEREGYIDVPGGKVWYRIIGSGNATPLLLLHGGPGGPCESLLPLEVLADERPVIFYDQLGGGRSDRPSDTNLWHIERFVEEVGCIREALELKEIHLFGHSWGTTLAAEYILTFPDGIKSLILASPCLSAKRWVEDADRLIAQLPVEIQETIIKNEEDGTTDSDEYKKAVFEYIKRHVCRLDPWPPELAKAAHGTGIPVYKTMWGPSEFCPTGNLKNYDCTARLYEISVPTLIIVDEYDEATPEAAAWYKSLIPDASLAVISNSSHMAMWEATDDYIKTVRAFLGSEGRKL
jgi:proline iminopeptidase